MKLNIFDKLQMKIDRQIINSIDKLFRDGVLVNDIKYPPGSEKGCPFIVELDNELVIIFAKTENIYYYYKSDGSGPFIRIYEYRLS